VYFMVSVDTPEDNQAFADKEQANFPMLSDPGRGVAEAYGVLPPINPDRPDAPRLARRWWFFIGPDGKVTHVETANHTRDAGEFLAGKLAELGVRKR
jgi:peroxiredoxin Q/BCP